MRPKLRPRPVAQPTLVGLQVVEQFRDALPRQIDHRQQRLILISDAPDAAMSRVAGRIARRIFAVRNQRVIPVNDVQSAVRPEFKVDRAKVQVGRLQQGLHLPAPDARPVRHNPVLFSALKTDVIVHQKVTLHRCRKLSARNEFDTCRGPHPRLGKSVDAGVLSGVLNPARHGRSKVIRPV